MRRFFVHSPEAHPRTLVLEGSEATHAARVLRVEPGDGLLALNGKGDQFTCQVTRASKSHVELQVMEHVHREPLPWRVCLVQALPKGGLMEDIVQKATELGVSRIVPLMSQRTEVRVTTAREVESKLEKWNTTAKEACKQCGGLWLPQIEAPQSMKTWLERSERAVDLAFVASLEGETHSHHYWFNEFERGQSRLARDIELWVGPEGDFTKEEYDLLRERGVLATTLGPLVLRCETAAISSLAITLAECREREDSAAAGKKSEGQAD